MLSDAIMVCYKASHTHEHNQTVPLSQPPRSSSLLFLFQQSPSVWWRDATVIQRSTMSREAIFESSSSSTHQTAPSKSCEYFSLSLALVSVTHTNTFPILALKHQTGFLFIRHFSPSISETRQPREKSCACMCTHTPLCHFHRHA